MVRLLAVALALALGACSSEGRGPLTGVLAERLAAILPGEDGEDTPETAGRARAITREQVEASGATLIRAGLAEETGRFVMSGVTDNGGYVTYASRLGQSVTLRGSLVTASRGIGFDLLAVETDAGDPLVAPVPPARWPETVTRRYVFPAPGVAGERLAVTCRFERVEPATIEIVEVRHETVLVRERCSGEASFVNLHHADAETGFVWRSRQWLGPRQGALALEIIEPLTED